MTEDFIVSLFAGWVAFLVAALSPGPNMIAVAAKALGAGRGPALRVASGIAVGAFFWATLSGLGISALVRAIPEVSRVLGLIGGSYLLFLSYKGFRAAFLGGKATIPALTEKGKSPDFFQGLLVTATNPKVALFWMSVSVLIGNTILPLGYVFLFSLGTAALAIIVYGSYGVLFSLPSCRDAYWRFQRFIEALFGCVFALLGVTLMVQ